MLRQTNSIVNNQKEKNTKKIHSSHDLDKYNNNPVFTKNKEIVSNTSKDYLGGEMLEATDIQRFNPYSLLDHIVYAVVHAEQKNWIVTLPGNRRQRSDDFKKKIFDKKYVLKRHTFGTNLKAKDPSNAGYYTQTWYVGNPKTFEQDVKDAHIKGPKDYYMPSDKLLKCIKIANAVCRTLKLFYSHKLNYSQTIAKINQCVFAINGVKKPFCKYTIHCIGHMIRDFFKTGNLNHIRGGCFGRGRGRRATKITENTRRPYTFHVAMCTKEGRRLISTEMIKICRSLSIKCTNRILKKSHIEIRKYYWSDRYLNNNDLKPGTKPLAIIIHCIKMLSYDLLLIAKHSHVYNYVHGPVSNENKTVHYYSPKRGITSEIDISKSKRHYTPPGNKYFNSNKRCKGIFAFNEIMRSKFGFISEEEKRDMAIIESGHNPQYIRHMEKLRQIEDIAKDVGHFIDTEINPIEALQASLEVKKSEKVPRLLRRSEMS